MAILGVQTTESMCRIQNGKEATRSWEVQIWKMHASKIWQRLQHWWSNPICYLFSFADFGYDKLHLVKQMRQNSLDMFLLTCMGHMQVIPFVGKRVKIASNEMWASSQESQNLHWDLLTVGFFRARTLLIVHALCQRLFIKWDSFSLDKAMTAGPELCDKSPVYPYSPNTSDIPQAFSRSLINDKVR